MTQTETFINKYFTPLSMLFILICSAVLLHFCIINAFAWHDEVYTLSMTSYSFSAIIDITAQDVHPPLYYLLLKVFHNITGQNTVFVSRLFSFLGIISCFLIAMFPVRRLLGKTTAFIFIVLLSILPVTQYLGTEIRMYSWTAFFVLGCSVYAYDTYRNATLFSYCMLTVFAVCSAYTHNYGLIAAGIVYMLLIAAQYLENKKVRHVIISLTAFAAAYAAWIPVIYRQIDTVQANYWIAPLTPKDLLLFFYYFFSPKDPEHLYTVFSRSVMIAGLSVMTVLIAVIILLIIKKHFKKPVDKTLYAGDAFVAVYLFTVIATLLISLTIKPIIVSRYTTCVSGPLLLGIAIYLKILIGDNRKVPVATALVMLSVLATARVFSETVLTNDIHKVQIEELKSFFNKKDSPEYIVATPKAYSLLAELSVTFPDKKLLVYSPYQYINYTPFRFGVIKYIPSDFRFFRVETLPAIDSVKIENFTIEDKLSFPRFNVYLLKGDSKNE